MTVPDQMDAKTLQESAIAVETLLSAAGLSVTVEEKARFVREYPMMRKQADSLYRPEFDEVVPAVGFDPTVSI